MEGVDTVFHLTSIKNAPETFDIPEKTWDVNYEGALNVYEEAREAGIEEFVNAVTCSVNGPTEEKSRRTSMLTPSRPYGEAKLEAEQEMFSQYHGEMGLTGLRQGTVSDGPTGMRFDTVVDNLHCWQRLTSP